MDTDKKIDLLIEEVAKKKAEIGKAEKSSWNTNMSFSFTEKQADAINLNVVRDIGEFAKMAGFLKYREASYENGVKELGITKAPPFKWQGYSVEDWLGDFRTKITKLQISAERKKLELLESRLDKIISPEKRRELELAAIMSELE